MNILYYCNLLLTRQDWRILSIKPNASHYIIPLCDYVRILFFYLHNQFSVCLTREPFKSHPMRIECVGFEGTIGGKHNNRWVTENIVLSGSKYCKSLCCIEGMPRISGYEIAYFWSKLSWKLKTYKIYRLYTLSKTLRPTPWVGHVTRLL